MKALWNRLKVNFTVQRNCSMSSFKLSSNSLKQLLYSNQISVVRRRRTPPRRVIFKRRRRREFTAA